MFSRMPWAKSAMFTTQCLSAALGPEIVLLLVLQFRNSNTPSRLCPEETLTHERWVGLAKKIPAQTIGSVWCGAVTAHWIYASATLLTAFV
jgi:hypothetical protein